MEIISTVDYTTGGRGRGTRPIPRRSCVRRGDAVSR
jgi:hypothetical protein